MTDAKMLANAIRSACLRAVTRKAEVEVIPGYLLSVEYARTRFGRVHALFYIRPVDGQTCIQNDVSKAGPERGARCFASWLAEHGK